MNNISNDIQSQCGNITSNIQSQCENIDNFINIEMKQGIEKMNKETLDYIIELIQHVEKIPNNVVDTFLGSESSAKGVYNPYTD